MEEPTLPQGGETGRESEGLGASLSLPCFLRSLFLLFPGDDFSKRRMGRPTMTAGGRMELWRIASVRACVCVCN